MKKVLALLLIVMLCALTFTSQPVEGQHGNNGIDKTRAGKVVRSYRAGQGGVRPAWVEAARTLSFEFLEQHGAVVGLRQATAELDFVAALDDDLGLTHVRLAQVHKGVPVFGNQIITHIDAKGVGETTGYINEAARWIDTSPRLTATAAIKAARAALDYKGDLSEQPTAKLVILPNVDGSDGATLTYQVELFVADNTKKPERHQYFVDANTGNIVWHYDSIPGGTGYSLYNGPVGIPTIYSGGVYQMIAPNHGSSNTRNAPTGQIYQDADDVWGNGSESSDQSAAVDAHFNMTCSWDYFRNKFGRLGLANNNAAVISYVHYGTNYVNAFYTGGNLYFGDGDASSSPLVSVDIVGHEYTHGVTEQAAGLVYSNESGASNESFSDIFGTAIEFLVNINPDYLIGEDAIPGGFRSMADPTIYGHPDHYSERVYIGTGYDNGGVHFNSGIQNKAFYLLAEGGTHPNNGITVTGIGRDAAERIFYRALDVYVTPNNQFINVRNATVSAATDLYGVGSAQYLATQRAWEAVGVGTSGGGGGGSTCNPNAQDQCEASGGTWNPSTCRCRALCSGCQIP